jgi:CheY-like chemotaxis protein
MNGGLECGRSLVRIPTPGEIVLQFDLGCPRVSGVKQPLALLLYEKLLPGSQLVNRLQDKGYRVRPVPMPGDFAAAAEREKPLVAFIDLEPHFERICSAIIELRKNPATAHIPVVAFASSQNAPAHDAARQAGATLVVNDSALLMHLPQFLDQALQVD